MRKSRQICRVVGCASKVYCKGCCRRHYNHLYRFGHIKDATVCEPTRIDIRRDVACIHLRNPFGKTMHLAMIDATDAKIAVKHKWRLDSDAVISSGYRNGKHCSLTLPRFLLGLKGKTTLVTHVNGDILDCRRKNLRIVNRSQLGYMAKIRSSNTSGYKGVSRDNNQKKWHAYLHVRGRRINGGRYKNLQDAVEARRRLEEKYFGERNMEDIEPIVKKYCDGMAETLALRSFSYCRNMEVVIRSV
ncbi:MAG: hypothetical protein WAX69_01585 [Victivallales bacterium]